MQKKEKIFLRFQPLRMTGSDPQWEDWNCYDNLLLVYQTDYNWLLMPYFEQLFPIADPINKNIQDRINVCFDNWIGKEDWQRFFCFIKNDMQIKIEELQKKKSTFEIFQKCFSNVTKSRKIYFG